MNKTNWTDAYNSDTQAMLAAAGQTPQMITIDEEEDNNKEEGDEIEILTENPKA